MRIIFCFDGNIYQYKPLSILSRTSHLSLHSSFHIKLLSRLILFNSAPWYVKWNSYIKIFYLKNKLVRILLALKLNRLVGGNLYFSCYVFFVCVQMINITMTLSGIIWKFCKKWIFNCWCQLIKVWTAVFNYLNAHLIHSEHAVREGNSCCPVKVESKRFGYQVNSYKWDKHTGGLGKGTSV